MYCCATQHLIANGTRDEAVADQPSHARKVLQQQRESVCDIYRSLSIAAIHTIKTHLALGAIGLFLYDHNTCRSVEHPHRPLPYELFALVCEVELMQVYT
jgi:hypothetical protein